MNQNSQTTIFIATTTLIVASFFLKNAIKKKSIPPTLVIDHSGGFFSCVNMKFHFIIKYINKHKQLPRKVDGSRQFEMYKNDKNRDVTFDFFKNYSSNISNLNLKKKIDYNENYQFDDYTKVFDFKTILPLFKNYFTPSPKVFDKVQELQAKYKINTDQCIGVYFRGTDKKTETAIPPFQTFYDKIKQVYLKTKDVNINIILQTDTAQFVDFVKSKSKSSDEIPMDKFIIIDENTTSYTSNGIHNEKTALDNYNDMFYLFATFLLLARSKYFICSSGNCSAIMMLYRGHCNNVYQILNDKWLR